MKNQKAIISFAKVKEHDFTDLAQNIVNKMTGNAYFPKPTPTLSVLQAAINEYADALAKCNDGTKVDTDNKNTKRAALEKHLGHLANYVNTIAEGDITKLDSSDFPLTKLPEPVGILPAPTDFKVLDGVIPGQVAVEWNKVPQALAYVMVYATMPAPANIEDWHGKTFTSIKNNISGLESGKKYVFKVAATSRKATTLAHIFSQLQ